MRNALVLCAALVAACSSDDTADGQCAHATECSAWGDTCTTATEHCTCDVGSGLQWECEPLACPAGDEVAGTSCPEDGLRCGTGFEDEGTICVGPELVWVDCIYDRSGTNPQPSCPFDAPTAGTPCCQLDVGGPGDTCEYGADRFDCVDHHWVILAP